MHLLGSRTSEARGHVRSPARFTRRGEDRVSRLLTHLDATSVARVPRFGCPPASAEALGVHGPRCSRRRAGRGERIPDVSFNRSGRRKTLAELGIIKAKRSLSRRTRSCLRKREKSPYGARFSPSPRAPRVAGRLPPYARILFQGS